MGTIRCMNCAGVLVEHEPVLGLLIKTPTGDEAPEEEEGRAFYRCRVCRARNFVAEARNSAGFPELRVVAYSFE
jgi:hypothetical protein